MSGIVSLLFYISAFIISTIFVYRANKENAIQFKFSLGARRLTINPQLIIGMLIPILVGGLRYGVGTDFSNYLYEYNVAIQSGSYLEVSFNIIANISNNLFGSSTFMFLVFSALTVVPVMLAMQKSTALKKDYRWLFWSLFLFMVFPQTFNLLRQGVAVALGFYFIISVIESRRLFKWSHVITLLLAISFHTTAWVLVLIGFIARGLNHKSKKNLFLFIFLSGLISPFVILLLPQLLQLTAIASTVYLNNDFVSQSVIPRSMLILTLLLICWKFYGVLKITNSYIGLLWVGLLFSIGGLVVAYFERAGYYVTLLIPLLVTIIITQTIQARRKYYAKIFVFLLGFAYFLGVYYAMGSSGIFPYNWNI